VSSIQRAQSDILARTVMFNGRSKECGSDRDEWRVERARELSQKIRTLLSSGWGGAIYRCPQGSCTLRNLSSSRATLRALAARLGGNAKATKLGTIKVCRVQHDPNKPDDKRPNSDVYTARLVSAVAKLPTRLYRCP
jgi:hypothetical protein